MTFVLIVGLLLIGSSLALVVRAALLPRMRAGESLGRIATYGLSGEVVVEPPQRAPMLPRLAGKLGDVLFHRSKEGRTDELRKLLLSAGIYGVTPRTFLGYRALAGAAAGMAALWMGSARGVSPTLLLLVAGYAAVIGWVLPLMVLKGRARRRLERIEIELPELIDLLVVTLEAGLGFNAAMQRASERMRGPLGDEVRLTLREESLGLATEHALRNMLERADALAVRSFVRAVSQGDSLGVSIGQVMRDLAGDMRTRRRQIIEEKAQKAPIKILFPLAFLILPSLFIVTLYPGVYNIIETLSGVG